MAKCDSGKQVMVSTKSTLEHNCVHHADKPPRSVCNVRLTGVPAMATNGVVEGAVERGFVKSVPT